jgi:tetratricopeptide (TPR) repeat protein
MAIPDFLAELKRRRVLRVVIGYLVAAWVAAQVASVLVPALHLPAWTVTFIVVLAIAGFPVAVALAWIFDITPQGVRRSPPRPGRKPRQARDAGPAPAAASVVPRAALATVALAAVLVAAGWLALRNRAADAEIDANAVVVLPFRVQGDASLEDLREGMVDLLVPRFTGQGGPRAVDERTTISAWRRAVRDPSDDLDPLRAAQLARGLGAGQVLLGTVVATPGRVTITATLHDRNGAVLQRAEQQGTPETLPAVVDQLAAQLLAAGAGEDRQRVSSLMSASLPALRAYLAGQSAYRVGRFYEAAGHFREAVDSDSTFALAALGLFSARGWSGYGPDHVRGRRLAWQYRDRLPPRDRAYLLAWLGPGFPDRAYPAIDQLRAWQEFVREFPDRVEAWYQLGDQLFHEGGVLGYDDALQRSLAAFERAMELDPDFAPARGHALEVYAIAGDTARLRREAAVYFANAPDAHRHTAYGWLVAQMLGDDAARARSRAALDSMETSALINVLGLARSVGIGYDDARRTLEILDDRARDDDAPVPQLFRRLHFELNAGRPAAAAAVVERLVAEPGMAGMAMWHLISMRYPEYDPSHSETVVDRLESQVQVLAEDIETRGNQMGIVCLLGERHVHAGRYDEARRQAARLHDEAARETDDWGRAFYRGCALMLDAGLAVAAQTANAPVLAARLDSLLIHGAVPGGPREHFNLAAMRLHAALGNPDAALAAVRRRDHYQSFAFAPSLLERARLHALRGDRDDAIRAYTHFLALRPEPEPGAATELTEAARRELAALVTERGAP